MHRAFAVLLSFLALWVVAPGCGGGGSGGTGGGSATGAIVVGVTSDLRINVDIDRLHVVMRKGIQVINDVVLTTTSKTNALALPDELRFDNLVEGDAVTVELEAFRPGDAIHALVRRVATTHAVAGKTLLLRVHIDSRCAGAPGSSAPVCSDPATCISGVCTSSAVDPNTLQAYSPGWTKVSTDVCKLGTGAPIVTVGQGQASYLPMNDLDVAQVEAGPQGGHHIWVAIRLKNLLQSGSIVAVTGHVDALGADIGPMQVIFSFSQDEGGYCTLSGLRFQLDQTIDIHQFLGKVLKVTVKVTDKDGDIGIGQRTVTLSKDFLN